MRLFLALVLVWLNSAQAGLSKVPEPGNQVVVDEMLNCLDKLGFDWKREDAPFYRATSLDGGRTQLNDQYLLMAGPEEGALTVFAKGSSQKFSLSNGEVDEAALLEACNSDDPVNQVREALKQDADRFSFEIPGSGSTVRQFTMNPFVAADGKLTRKAQSLLKFYEGKGCNSEKFASSFAAPKSRPVVSGPFLKRRKVLEPQPVPAAQRDAFGEALTGLAQEKLRKARALSKDSVTGLPSGQGFAGSSVKEVVACRNELTRERWKGSSLYESLSAIREDLAKIESAPLETRPNGVPSGSKRGL
jgi:hypothetical protein